MSVFNEMSNSERRRVIIEVAALLLVPTAGIILIILAATSGVIWWDGRERAHDNRALIERLQEVEQRQDAQAKQVRTRLKRTDVLVCREIERLKTRVRREANENFRELRRNAELLDIELTPELIQAVRQERNQTLRRYAAREGGCGTLPSVRR